jgi:hypothetical protein
MVDEGPRDNRQAGGGYHRAETAAELRHGLTAVGHGVTFVEVVLDKYDGAPPPLRTLAARGGGGAPVKN